MSSMSQLLLRRTSLKPVESNYLLTATLSHYNSNAMGVLQVKYTHS